MLEIFQYTFFQRALIVALVASIACGIIGTYIVVKRLSLITGSIAHSTFGGLGISYFFQFQALLGAAIFGTLAAIGISSFKEKASDRIDVLLSFLWTVGMAIGLVFIFLTPGYATDLFTYLFGNILLVSKSDLYTIIGLDLLIIAVVALLYKTITITLFDEEYAQLRNIPTRLIHAILYALIALTIVSLIRIVGIVLMIALLTLPAATAQFFHRKLQSIMFTASIITAVSIIGGLLLSYVLNFATGPIIVLLVATIYLLAALLKGKKRK